MENVKAFAELTPQEVNDLVATKVCGWGAGDDNYYDEAYDVKNAALFTPASNLSDCHIAEEKLGDSQGRYLLELSRIVYKEDDLGGDFMQMVWRHVHATASQKCHAMLLAIGAVSK